MFETQLQSYHHLAFIQGLYSLTLAVCLATASASPIIPPLVPGLAAGTTIALTSAGLVTTAGGVAVNTVPLAGVALAGGAVLAGGAALAVDKILLIEAIRNELNKQNNANNRG